MIQKGGVCVADFNNDIVTLFELVGKITINARDAIKDIISVEKKANDASDSITKRFENLERDISNINLNPEVDTNEAAKELERFKRECTELMKEIEADATITVDSDQAMKDLKRLRGQLDRLQVKVENGDFSDQTGAQLQQKRVLDTIDRLSKNLKKSVDAEGKSTRLETKILDKIGQNVQKLVSSVTNIQNVGEISQETSYGLTNEALPNQSAVNGNPPQNGPPNQNGQDDESSDSSNDSNQDSNNESKGIGAAELASILALMESSRGKRRYGRAYDVDRSERMQMAYQRKMLEYASRLSPQNLLPRITARLDMSRTMIPYFNEASNMLQARAAFGMMESGVTNARKRLAQLGFGRTKQEIKAIEAQMHQLANTRLDNLKDQIRLTEKALKDMRSAANADEFADEIKKAEEALKHYNAEVKKVQVAQKVAQVNGYQVGKFGGKQVIYKGYSNVLEKLGGKIVATANRDIAYALNKAYNSMDKSAIKIVGDQGTKALNKAKVGQLATAFQTLGMQMQMAVPIVGMLTAGIVALGKTADEAASQFEARTLINDKRMRVQKRDITDVSVATGADSQEVSETMSTLYNEMGLRGTDLKQATEYGHQFAKVWGVDAVEAVDKVKKISKQLHISEAQAQNIMTLALTKYNGDIEQATKDVLAHGKAWEDTSKTNMGAYQKMTEGSMSAFDKLARATRQAGAALIEIWSAMEPLVTKIADKVYDISKAFTEWMREHPNAAKWIGYLAAITAGLTALSVVLLPLMGFLLMNRSLFQALAQGLGLMGKGIAVVNPQAKMMLDNMKMMKNGLLGMPRLMRSFVPGLFALFRGLPGMIASTVFQFIKLNPILSTIAALALLISKNFDKFKPSLESIWNSLKRIGKAFLDAFGGEGQSSAEQFNDILKKISDIAAKILVPALETLAKILKIVANLMEGGGANVVATGLKFAFFAAIIGKVVQSLGRLSKGFSKAKSGVTGLLASMAKFNAFKLKSKKAKMTGSTTLNASTQSVAQNIGEQVGNNQVLRTKGSIIVNGSPVHVNGNIKGPSVGTLDGGRAKNISKNAKSKKIVIPSVDLNSSVKSVEKSGVFSKITRIFKKKGPSIIKSFGKVMLKAIPRAFAMLTGPIGTAVMLAFDIAPFLFKNKGKIINALLKYGKWGIKGFKAGLSTISSITGTVVGWFNKYLVKPIASFLGIASPSKLFAKFGRWIIQGLVNGMRKALGSIASVLKSIGKSFIHFGKQIYKIVSSYFLRIYKRISSLMSSIRKRISSILATIRKLFSSVLRQIWKTVSSIFKGIYNTIRGWINRARSFISGALSKIGRSFSNVFRIIYRNVKSAMSSIYARIKGTFNSISSFFGRVAKKSWKWGSEIVSGIINGITDGIGYLWDAAERAAHTLTRAFKKTLGIASPSKVFRVLTRWVSKGASLGVKDGLPDIKKASTDMANTLQDNFNPELAVNDVAGYLFNRGRATATPLAKMAGNSNATNNMTTNSNISKGGVIIQKLVLQVQKLQSEQDFNNMYEHFVGKMDREVRRRKR